MSEDSGDSRADIDVPPIALPQTARGIPADWAETESQLLRTIARALSDTEDLTAALEVVLRGVCEATGWTLGQAWLVSSDGSLLSCSPAWFSRSTGLDAFRAASQLLRFRPAEGLPGRAWATRQPAWTRDISQDRSLPRARAARQAGLRAGFAIPVQSGAQVVGVLEFFQFDRRPEDERMVALVGALAAHLGQLIRRKQAEEDLRLSEARHRAVVDTAADAIITMTIDGLVRSFNRGAEQLFGYKAEEVISQPLTMLMPERTRSSHTAGLRRYLQTGEAHVIGRMLAVTGLRKDGSEVSLELTVTPIPEPTGVLFAGILRDASERQRLDAERAALLAVEREHVRHLRALTALKDDFTTLVAHELGSPLAAARALADMLASGGLSPQEHAGSLATLQAELRVLTALVADVQVAADLEQDSFSVRPRSASVADLVAEAAAFAQTLPGGRSVVTTVDEDRQVMADPERIGQVLRNLLVNAAKYSPPDTPIELRAHSRGAYVHVEVANQGPGISPQDRARIFEKFWRAPEHRQAGVAGLGLGLYLARRLCLAHGADLTLRTAPGQGATFAFNLPLDPSGRSVDADDAVADRDHQRLQSRVGAQLAQDTQHVVAGGLPAHGQALGNFLIGQTLG